MKLHLRSHRLRSHLNATVLIFLTAVIFSCENHLDQIKLDEKSRPEIFIENGILNFKSQKIFERTIKEMQSMTEEEMVDWSKSFSFNSLIVSFNQAKKKRREIFDKMELIESKAINLSENGKKKFIEENSNTINSLKKEYRNFLDNYSFLRFEGNLVVGMNIQNYFASPLVNKDGIVKVEGFYYQFVENDLKIIRDKGLESLMTLKNSNSTDSSDEVYFSSDAQGIITSRIQGRTSEEKTDEDGCEFAFDSDRSGDKYARSYLASKTIRYPRYKTVQRTTCRCVEWSGSGSGPFFGDIDKDDFEIGDGPVCIREECTTQNVSVFSHWEVTEIHVTTQLASYKMSCTNFLFFEVCKTDPKKVSLLKMEVLFGGINFPGTNKKEMVGHNVSSLSYIGIYNDPSKFNSYVYDYPRPGQAIQVNFIVNEDITGGFANCVNQVQL